MEEPKSPEAVERRPAHSPPYRQTAEPHILVRREAMLQEGSQGVLVPRLETQKHHLDQFRLSHPGTLAGP